MYNTCTKHKPCQSVSRTPSASLSPSNPSAKASQSKSVCHTPSGRRDTTSLPRKSLSQRQGSASVQQTQESSVYSPEMSDMDDEGPIKGL